MSVDAEVKTAAPVLNVPPKKSIRIRIPASLASVSLLAVFLLVWEFYVDYFKVSAFILPSPSDALMAWIYSLGSVRTWQNTWVTVYESASGFICATIVGVGIGALIGKSAYFERVVNPFIIATQVIPKVALVPLFIVWFGFGPTSKVITAAVLSFFPILTNTVLGVKSINFSHRDVMSTLNASRWQTFTQLEFRSALPYIPHRHGSRRRAGNDRRCRWRIPRRQFGARQSRSQGNERVQHRRAVRRHHPAVDPGIRLLRRHQGLPQTRHPLA